MWYCYKHECKEPVFLTARQAAELGATIKEDAEALKVTFFSEIVNIDKDDSNKVKMSHFVRVYYVYNVRDCEGLDIAKDEKTYTWEPLKKCDEIILGYKDRPKIHEKDTGRAFYRPSIDEIFLPPMKDFKSIEGFYSTAFHELVHSTGHKSRLNRHTEKDAAIGDELDYSKEELIAQIGASFLCAEAGIYNRHEQERSADYIKGWISVFKDKPSMLWQCAAKAQRAVDYMLGVKFDK
jgi:antirestriction protein ArdC